MPDITNTQNNSGVKMPLIGVFYAALSAVLFGLTTPVSKVLLDVGPFLLAGLLYAGSGLGLLVWEISRLILGKSEPLKLGSKDLGRLLLVILCGGIAAPVFLLMGLVSLPASSASLFLNLEGVFTALIAWLVFREAADRRLVLGMVAIVAAGLVLSVNFTGGSLAISQGALFIAAACLCWALDNNITGRIEALSATRIALAKGLAAGSCNIAIALCTQKVAATSSAVLGTALLAGFLGYGLSLTLFIRAQRSLGTARTSAYFAAAPFVGAAVSIVAFHEQLSMQLGAATLLMALGLYLHLSEEHSHKHSHDDEEHEHEHEHDDSAPDPHHQHEHEDGLPFKGKHSHKHRHLAVEHSHPHYPDTHHRHRH